MLSINLGSSASRSATASSSATVVIVVDDTLPTQQPKTIQIVYRDI